MKNIKSAKVRALTNKDLKKIKGGGVPESKGSSGRPTVYQDAVPDSKKSGDGIYDFDIDQE